MADWLNAIILGLVEGLTEFIPVSSTGHLLLAARLLGLEDPSWKTFVVLIQLGAILSVVVLYFQRLWDVVLRLPSDPAARRFVLSVLIAFLPAVAAGLGLHKVINGTFMESVSLICWSLIIGGVLLIVLDRWRPTPRHEDAMTLPLHTSLIIGLVQCLALVPGVSRSGATIAGAMLAGVDRKAAAEFSFFLAMPTMAGAFTLDLWDARDTLNSSQAWLIAIGFGVSFLVGLAVVKWMIGFVGKRGFSLFGVWRIVVGALGLWLIRG
ncbi:undecaprenyl-diphosphatase [Caulobacter ginsengisoli]|uniref:Undecaprenyl-diphosphatase n=1 Tax=Caulobacter ginsengisoli TaxID=400775 RepID=A0ABU0ITV9_9CAUL|nr:undecaprenyl-diphosphate phosphatase [Caulobacter ginsengisoli]MDQ0465441.1 undecaprenyl-diphosphatase [Caulobacter ginsengisoli]